MSVMPKCHYTADIHLHGVKSWTVKFDTIFHCSPSLPVQNLSHSLCMSCTELISFY